MFLLPLDVYLFIYLEASRLCLIFEGMLMRYFIRFSVPSGKDNGSSILNAIADLTC